ncbi:MAG: DUF504 domain-containing protein [Methanoregula sp.]|jgi:uncharacterized protein (UPF0248 family)|uniref:DUF504 domain-containing protein n=1 Tax=Methanoregula sp. TaxID=2052170 RepID=UPI003C1FF254
MLTSHKLLLKYWHDQRYTFSDIIVCYVNRGVPGDRSCVSGRDICNLDAYYFEIVSGDQTTCIPYHRISKITYKRDTIWER